MHTPKYDILRNTWIYQEIKQEVLDGLMGQFLATQRRLLLEIVEGRFPRLCSLAMGVVPAISQVDLLNGLITAIATARLEKDARQSLLQVGAHERSAETD